MDVLLVLHQLVAHLLIKVRALGADLRQVLQRRLHKVETVHIVLYAYVKRRRDVLKHEFPKSLYISDN